MKLIFISDTHTKHSKLFIPPCDILFCCGDISFTGERFEVVNFASWFNEQPARYKIFIPGNHEVALEKYLPESKLWLTESCPDIKILLHESITIEGIKIFGSPYTPIFQDWAFMRSNSDRERLWKQIPEDTEILITHGPAFGVLDNFLTNYTDDNKFVPTYRKYIGCKYLSSKINLLPNLKIHAFGHCHAGYGRSQGNYINNKLISINAASCSENYEIENAPQLIEFPPN